MIGFGFGAAILVLIAAVYYIKTRSSSNSSTAQKNYMQEKYNNFDNEGENEEENN